MSATILVATPHAAFGELLRISLIDSGQYQVHLVRSASEARASSEHTVYHLVILDAVLEDEPFIPLCMDILDKQPGVRLVVIPPDNNPNHPALGGLMPHGYLSRPFYLPELIETVSRLLAHRERQFQSQTPTSIEAVPGDYPSTTIPPWLQEPLMLRSCLQKEIAGTQAIAAIAGLSGAIRACVGNLNDAAAQELIEVVFRHWNQAEKTDLMRFVRLNADKKDYLVYATHVLDELALILIFDTAAPLSQIRPQTKAMAHALAVIPPEEFGAQHTAEPHAAPVDATTGQPATQPAADFPISAPPVPPAADNSIISNPSESETQPLSDNLFFGRVYNSFTDPSISASGTKFSAEEDGNSNLLYSTPEPVDTASSSDPVDDPREPNEGEEEDGFDSGVINLTALLGSVPPPDPERNEPRKPIYGADWFPERSASNPTPTLAGGLNGASSENTPPFPPVWQFPDESDSLNKSNEKQADPQTGPDSQNENAWTKEQPPVRKAARTAPLDPQTMPLNSLTADPALPKDYAPPAYDPPIDIEDADFLQAVSGRPASLEVKTEPPVTPPGVPAAIKSRPSGNNTDLLAENEQLPIPIEDTHPNVVSTITSLGQLEPASPALSLLNYTCVLVPRLPQHYLTGELADRMAGWVQQLCLAFGWRLEGISIRPEYLQWTVQVAPAISPGNLVRIVRQRTSLHVFGNYSHLAEQNPSGDFWATGYLIVSGAQPPSAQLLRDYIAQTRKRQGANK